jgi:ribosomal protein S14
MVERPPSGGDGSRSSRDRLIVDRYIAGVPVVQIADEAGVCRKTVRNVARKAGVPPRTLTKPERNARALALYKAGMAVQTITTELGIGRSQLRKIAARAGIPPRRGWQRRYPLNEEAFEQPSPIGWWLVGLLAADGSIHEPEHRVSLCQTLDDADVLHAFLDYVGCPDRPLAMLKLSPEAAARQFPRRPAAEARIFSARICASLARHGIVPRKTSTLTLSEEAARKAAVWLGLLDGDGTVGIYRDGNRGRPTITFTGTSTVMGQCERFWRGVLGYSSPRPAATPHSRRLWTFRLYGAHAVTAARLLLTASPVSMNRKRRVLEQVAAKSTENAEPALRSGQRLAMVSSRKETKQWQE